MTDQKFEGKFIKGVLIVPFDFHYQNEKQVAANQSYLFQKFSKYEISFLTHIFFYFCIYNGEEQKNTT